MLLVSLYSPRFLPFLAAMSVFLLGMGIVNPLGHGAGAVAVRREGRRGIRAGRLLADDGGCDRRLARGHDLA